MSDPPYDVEKDPYPLMSKWRQSERHNMIAALRDLIDEASRMAKSKRAPASERIRWTRLAGQLIWYKDAILRSMSLESMENVRHQERSLRKETGTKTSTRLHVPNLR